MNVKGTRVSAHVQLGLTPGDERQILSDLRYLKHTWSKEILVGTLLAKNTHPFRKCQVSSLHKSESPALSILGVYNFSNLQCSERCNLIALVTYIQNINKEYVQAIQHSLKKKN